MTATVEVPGVSIEISVTTTGVDCKTAIARAVDALKFARDEVLKLFGL